MVQTQDPLAQDYLGPRVIIRKKIGKGPPDNAAYQISSTCVKQF